MTATCFCDGDVDFFDMDPFVAAFGGTGLRTAYGWDAENRLIRVGPVAGYEMAGDVQVTFAYDYLSRRVAKRVQVYDPNASPAWVLTKNRRPAVERVDRVRGLPKWGRSTGFSQSTRHLACTVLSVDPAFG